ncbi:MAG: FTR1 family iron permease [Deltaproteobacteria bacterium]|jgi:high-affinity iron transporter|nr:FTR1 family iron permease [Deltaproteobacteria bacterium]
MKTGTLRGSALTAASLALACAALTLYASRADAQPKFNNWTEISKAMAVSLNKGYDVYAAGGSASWEEARDWVNDAYFGYYEKEGFERMVKSSISGKRASTVEYKFATIKTKLKDGVDSSVILSEINDLIAMLEEDATALDIKFNLVQAAPSAPAAGGGAAEAPAGSVEGAAQTAGAGPQEDGGAAQPASGGGPGGGASGTTSFLMSLGILLREGFEAILVIAAIAAYLKRCGMLAQVRTVYWSSAAAVAASFAAAVALQAVFSVSGAKQEILEGFTMLLATAVLFGVSNWMFSKAEAEAWKSYIAGKVQVAVATGSSFALGAAAFLAVFREGAETILFYQSLFATQGADPFMIWTGFAVGCVGLALIFVIIRHGTQIIPLKPFFIGTSILMFVMSIAFLGGGIKELQEGDVFGVTPVEFMPTIDILGVYPCLQTLVPQAVLLLFAVLSIIWIKARQKPTAPLAGASGPARA